MGCFSWFYVDINSWHVKLRINSISLNKEYWATLFFTPASIDWIIKEFNFSYKYGRISGKDKHTIAIHCSDFLYLLWRSGSKDFNQDRLICARTLSVLKKQLKFKILKRKCVWPHACKSVNIYRYFEWVYLLTDWPSKTYIYGLFDTPSIIMGWWDKQGHHSLQEVATELRVQSFD